MTPLVSNHAHTEKTTYKLFTSVLPFYENLLANLQTAQHVISMMYFTFDYGEWTLKFSEVLKTKVNEGVRVRLMVDELGLIVDQPKHALVNQTFMQTLKDAGVQVEIFRPKGHRLSQMNRLHFKVCAIDHHTVFLGGSNLGDHYLDWDDSNLRLQGALGSTFHQVFDYLLQFTRGEVDSTEDRLRLTNLKAGDVQLWFTIPRQRKDIRRKMLSLILDADNTTQTYFRNWYFLPDDEILDAMRSQANQGVGINVLLSHRTRVWLIDLANYVHSHKLAKAGGRVYRFTGGYMHAKISWNNKGYILFGSANMDAKALEGNFECCVTFTDKKLAGQLQRAFSKDAEQSIRQTPEVFLKRSFAKKALSYACNIASPWL